MFRKIVNSFFTLILISLICGISTADADIVSVPDNGLAKAIRLHFGLEDLDNAPITVEMMKDLGELRAESGWWNWDGSPKISDLTGLEYATNIHTLYLNDNQISNLQPLENLPKLRVLVLFNNQISNLQPLATLKNSLETLQLQNNRINDVTPLAGLTKLWALFLEGNPLGDTSSLANLNLRNKDFEITQPVAVTPNPVPESVVVTPNPVPESVVVTQPPGQQVDGVSIPDAALANALRTTLGLTAEDTITRNHMLSLIAFEADFLRIRDLTGLEYATNLRFLYLDFNKISNLQPLARLTNLQTLNLQNNQISDVTPLAGLVNLRHLSLRENPLTDTSPLAKLPKLEKVDVVIKDPGTTVGVKVGVKEKDSQGVSIPDPALQQVIRSALGLSLDVKITAQAMQSLFILNAPHRAIRNLAGIEHATNLKQLSLAGNPIINFAPLLQLSNLQLLDLSNINQNNVNPAIVNSMSALIALPHLKVLRLSQNQIADVTVLARLPNL